MKKHGVSGAADMERNGDEFARPQEIRIGGEQAVVVPLAVWRRLMEEMEELQDIRAYDRAKADPDQKTIEHDELCRMLGRSPLRYLRGRQNLTQARLSKKTGLSQSYIAKLEAGERRPSKTALKKIAAALKIEPEKLIY
ncbi:MAG TPA: helix-turn-helix transcriptional regulator [bacterium]|nr:helix-turn-helix transcriptional regulator [bacterium]